jgi:hypothetical protein
MFARTDDLVTQMKKAKAFIKIVLEDEKNRNQQIKRLSLQEVDFCLAIIPQVEAELKKDDSMSLFDYPHRILLTTSEARQLDQKLLKKIPQLVLELQLQKINLIADKERQDSEMKLRSQLYQQQMLAILEKKGSLSSQSISNEVLPLDVTDLNEQTVLEAQNTVAIQALNEKADLVAELKTVYNRINDLEEEKLKQKMAFEDAMKQVHKLTADFALLQAQFNVLQTENLATLKRLHDFQMENKPQTLSLGTEEKTSLVEIKREDLAAIINLNFKSSGSIFSKRNADVPALRKLLASNKQTFSYKEIEDRVDLKYLSIFQNAYKIDGFTPQSATECVAYKLGCLFHPVSNTLKLDSTNVQMPSPR